MRFGLPVLNDQGAQNILDPFGLFNLGTVGNKLVHSSPLRDVIKKGVAKLLFRISSRKHRKQVISDQ